MDGREFSGSWRKFKNNNIKEIIVINIISSLLYLAIISVSIKISYIILGIDSSFIFKNESDLLKMLIIFFCGLILAFYTTVLPFFISINRKFSENIKKTIAVLMFDLLTGMIIGRIFNNMCLAVSYLLLCYGGTVLSLGVKYTSIKLRGMKN